MAGGFHARENPGVAHTPESELNGLPTGGGARNGTATRFGRFSQAAKKVGKSSVERTRVVVPRAARWTRKAGAATVRGTFKAGQITSEGLRKSAPHVKQAVKTATPHLKNGARFVYDHRKEIRAAIIVVAKATSGTKLGSSTNRLAGTAGRWNRAIDQANTGRLSKKRTSVTRQLHGRDDSGCFCRWFVNHRGQGFVIVVHCANRRRVVRGSKVHVPTRSTVGQPTRS